MERKHVVSKVGRRRMIIGLETQTHKQTQKQETEGKRNETCALESENYDMNVYHEKLSLRYICLAEFCTKKKKARKKASDEEEQDDKGQRRSKESTHCVRTMDAGGRKERMEGRGSSD